MKSHAIASSQPPPSAKPFTAAITGLSSRLRSSISPKSFVSTISAYDFDCITLMSAPAANALSPAPVSTIAPTAGSASSARASSTSDATRSGESAFSAFGRLSVRRPTAPRTSRSTGASAEEESVRRSSGARSTLSFVVARSIALSSRRRRP